MRTRRFLRVLAGLATAAAVHSALAPALAVAGEDAAMWANKGAQAFKVNSFYDAAVAFERAAQLDPGQPKNLRYAGRAWQQVGHWKKALALLELYVKIEPSAEHRASIGEYLEPLRAATARQRAEALQRALVQYPQARLEADAAAAWEEVADEAGYKAAADLWEVARVRAASDVERQTAEVGVRRAQARWQALRDTREAESRRRVAGKPGDVQASNTGSRPVAATSEGGMDMRTPLLVAGGVLAAGGLAAAGIGFFGARDVDQTAAQGGYAHAYSTYVADRDRNVTLQYLGWAAVGVGAGLGIWALLSEPKRGPTATVVPGAGAASAGLSVVGFF